MEREWQEVVQAFWTNYLRTWPNAPAPRPADDDPDALAEWLRAQEGDFEAGEETWWAWRAVDQLADDGGEHAVNRLVELARAAPGNDALAYLGAGPIEDLVRLHGPRLLPDLIAAARKHPEFKRALAGMYVSVIPAEIREELVQAIEAPD